MRHLFSALLVCIISLAHAQKDTTVSLKSMLLEQLRTTRNVKDWFVPVDSAIAGLTAEQAMWKTSLPYWQQIQEKSP